MTHLFHQRLCCVAVGVLVVLSSAFLGFITPSLHSPPLRAAAVFGKVTYEGKPIEKGLINFVSEGDSINATASITNGEYRCTVTPGQKSIVIGAGKLGENNNIAKDAVGNFQTVDVPPSGRKLDIALAKPARKK